MDAGVSQCSLFTFAPDSHGIELLHLSSSDVDVDKPDDKSIMTYVAQFLKHYPDVQSAESEGPPEEVKASGFTLC